MSSKLLQIDGSQQSLHTEKADEDQPLITWGQNPDQSGNLSDDAQEKTEFQKRMSQMKTENSQPEIEYDAQGAPTVNIKMHKKENKKGKKLPEKE